MKVGKEGIVGAIAALEAWALRDHAGMRAVETGYLELWRKRLDGRAGVTVAIEPDPTNNPLDRLKLSVDPNQARITAWELADALAAGDPPVIVRDHEVEHGFFYLDPCNLHPGEAEIVADRLLAELTNARARKKARVATAAGRKAARFERLLKWPD
jgi:D-glucosaminate-6-phosphate ammonia-lyase